MILILLVISLIAVMFYNPKDYSPKVYYKPTRIERYIKNVDKLLKQGHYSIVSDLLSRTKYSHEQLPWKYWHEQIEAKISRIQTESRPLKDLKDLEKILGP